MLDFEKFSIVYENILHCIAQTTIYTLELVGITIIIIGSIRAIAQTAKALVKGYHSNIMIALGRALALALEFKMGAEIVKTVIIHDLNELAILAVVIALRSILAFLIHWEIKNEKKEELESVDDTEGKGKE